MLRGSHVATVDEKGRVKIPADFLAELRKTGKKFYVTSDRGDRAQIYPLKEWEAIEKKLAGVPSHNEFKRKFLARTNYFGQMVELDGQGRILIPPVLREAAEMRGEVSVEGLLTHLEVWNRARFEEKFIRPGMTAEDDKMLEQLGI